MGEVEPFEGLCGRSPGQSDLSIFSLQQALIYKAGDYSREGFWAKVQGQGEVRWIYGSLCSGDKHQGLNLTLAKPHNLIICQSFI